MINPDTLLRRLFDKAVEVADPMKTLGDFLPPKPDGRLVVVGAGKASARMAEAVEATYGPCEGLVITRYGYARPSKGIEIVEAAHPVPDMEGVKATQRMLKLMETCEEGNHVLALISGGGSALLCAPASGITLEEKQELTDALLASGMPIGDINGIRKQISAVKGGKLAAAAWPATMHCLMVSDVPGDNPADMASGPTVGNDGDAELALATMAKWNVKPPASIDAFLRAGGDPLPADHETMQRVTNEIYAASSQSLKAAAELAEELGCEPRILGDDIEGEAREIAAQQAQMAVAVQASLSPDDKPVLLLSGGELTVTRRGNGVGGPNSEFCLAMAVALNGAPGIHALACDTDGVDGAAEVAGAVVGPVTLSEAGEDVQAALDNNDAHGFFERNGGQVVTGPTLTNVNDFRAILIEPRG